MSITSLLEDPNTMTLVSTVISLSHALGMKVVAEGVESEDQAKILSLMRCDEIQGYLYSKPIPFDSMTACLIAACWKLDVTVVSDAKKSTFVSHFRLLVNPN
jgi:EAL domain-containing protein (putative c-di-GMP-specific phosphodiesterase class I)